MNELYIVDRAFAHCDYLAYLYPSSIFRWNRDLSGVTPEDIVVITDNNVNYYQQYPGKKVALLIEPEAIKPDVYSWIKDNYQNFEKVLTFDSDLLSIDKKFVFYPYGTTWIPEDKRDLYSKNVLLSIIASEKRQTVGHELRHQIIQRFQPIYPDSLNIWGRGYNPIDDKLWGLKPYAFQIVVENSKKDYYFTEKLLDCFATGTIPIYWGCPSIGDFFDLNGIITFDTLDELDEILKNLSFETYADKFQAVVNNFNKLVDFIKTDDYIYAKLKND